MKKRNVYLDNASTTPLNKDVLKAMMPFFKENYGNSSNIYELGRKSREAVGQATMTISKIIGCRPSEFIYTGSATESDNLALAGVARANKENGRRIIISSLEHKGIFSISEALKKEGFEIIELPANKQGLVDLEFLKSSLNKETILVSITMADSETGTIQPIKEIGSIISTFRAGNSARNGLPYFHSDASQAAGHMDINVDKLGLDLLTLSAHKLGGPKGIGGLYVRNGVKIQPIIYGGGQQGRLRSGTENVPAIVGFGKAFELTEKGKLIERARQKSLRDRLEMGIFKSIPKVVLNGHKTRRLPNFLNVAILDIEGEALLLHLDEYGIVANTGSACNSESLEPSYVLSAMGNPYEFVHGSIRFTLGPETTKKDIDYVLTYLPKIVTELRSISPLNLALDQKQMAAPLAFIGNQTPHFLRKNPPPFSRSAPSGQPSRRMCSFAPFQRGIPKARFQIISKHSRSRIPPLKKGVDLSKAKGRGI